MNSNERNELYKQYEDCLFRVLMYRYAENEGERFIVENEALKRENKYQPSPKAVGRFNKSVNTAIKQSKLLSFMKSIRPLINKAAALAYEGGGEYVPGEHCQFCRASVKCRARAESKMKLAAFEFALPPLLTDDG